jgi:D-beta-D-heptose 7-phosphate kinase/D-beta-D-heptose 1-phosphate adenosyltransferase
LSRIVRRAKAQGRRVVFTNGCFDLLHAGHVTLLERARRQGDLLVVAINSDRSVRALKGRHRPVVTARDRALVLASLESVDYVTEFHQLTPRQAIARLRPQVLVKGADWSAGRVVGREIVERDGGKVVRIPLMPGRSTSTLARRLRSL